MLKITCAQCNASLQVKPTLAGRTIRCPRCKQPTLVALAPVALEPEVEEVEIVDDADDAADEAAFMPVAAKSPPKSAGKFPAKSTAKRPSRNDEAEFEPEFEMDDAPAKSRKGLWIGLGIGSGVLGLVVAGVAVWMMMPPPAPRDPFAQLKAKVEAELKAKGIKIEPENAPHSLVEAEPKKIVAVPPKVEPKTPVDPKTPTSSDLNPKDPVPGPTTPPKKGKIDPEPAPPEHVAAAPKADPRPTAKSPTKTTPTKTTPPVVTTLPVDKTPPAKSPEIVKTTPPPVVGKTTVGDLVFETVKVDAKNVVPSLTWAVDGKSFYCLQSTGKLQRFGADDLSVLADADLGAGCTGMALSSEGLIVARPAAEEAVVLELANLYVRRKIAIPDLARIAAGAKAPLAVAVTRGEEIALVDPRTAKIVQKQRADDLALGAGPLTQAVMTPDGKYVFVESKLKLHRLRVVDHTLVHEQATRPIATKPGRIDVSSDGNYVSLSSETGNSDTGLRTFVFQVEDLTTPDAILNAGAPPRTVGFDSARDRIYAQNSKFALIAFSKAGRKLQEYALPGAGETRQIACGRTGDVLVLTDERLLRARRGE